VKRERTLVLHAVTSSISLWLMRGQLRYLSEAGFEIGALCSPGPQVKAAEAAERVSVYPVPMQREISPLRDLVSLMRLLVLMWRLRPALVNAGTPKAGLLAGLAARISGVPCRYYTLRGLRLETATGWKRRLLWLCEWLACACAQRIICVGPSLRDRAVELGIVPPEKALVLGAGSSNGVDASRFGVTAERQAQAEQWRARLGISPDAPVIGYIGRFTRDKGIPELITAFQDLRMRLPDAVLMMVGGFESGDPVPAETEAFVRSGQGVVTVDMTAEIAKCYLAMDVFVLPTRREGFPNTVLEAQAAGRPVVTTRATGAVDSVIDGITGLLVPVGDPKALADALECLLADREKAITMGKAGQARVSREFSQEQVWRALVQEYTGIARAAGLALTARRTEQVQIAEEANDRFQ
jgi:glycosyltransferase involved in cell wall biosynthesis